MNHTNMTKSLVIVESPAKARTLKKYLGKDFDVKASVGHIRDLPVNRIGVDLKNDFQPQYVTIKGKTKIIADLKKSAKQADEIYLAPDPDREGEAIAWHIAHCLKGAKKPIHRALFHELTKKAILAAITNSTAINRKRFEAQQARRILDRLVGYQISPLLWKKVRRGLSAGRVQSVAVRMICEREEEILTFRPEEYWTIEEQLTRGDGAAFAAQLDRIGGKKAAIKNGTEAENIVTALKKADHLVEKIEKKKRQRHPAPPFITSTLQQDANRKLRFTAKKTMTLAQKLYEGIELGDQGPTGLITYMRTDSIRVNEEALTGVRNFIKDAYGNEFLPPKPIGYKTSKSAQDAHEAIRPTDVTLTPEKLANQLDKDLLALYTLIWKRFIASQMKPAVYDQTTIFITADAYRLKAVGSIMRFQGFMTLYVEATDDSTPQNGAKMSGKAEKSADSEVMLPNLDQGDQLQLIEIQPSQHFTQPPPRYNEATLVKALEENGVGRPSTYASIISTIVEKEYVLLEQRKFYPTDLGKLVNDLLVAHFPSIINVEFTAQMENDLDKVEEGEAEWLELLRKFYGPFEESLKKATTEMKSVKRQAEPTDIPCKLCNGKLMIKWGRMGEFLACENFPECKFTQNFTRGEDGTIIPLEPEMEEAPGETCEKCGRPMVYRHGRFGKFLACSGYPACKHIRSQTTGVACPEEGCTGEIVQKASKRGKVFYGCNRYPKCSFALWDMPVPQSCPLCGNPYLVVKQRKNSPPRLRCPSRSCKYSAALTEENK
jgi:DNA topoisomerase-1